MGARRPEPAGVETLPVPRGERVDVLGDVAGERPLLLGSDASSRPAVFEHGETLGVHLPSANSDGHPS